MRARTADAGSGKLDAKVCTVICMYIHNNPYRSGPAENSNSTLDPVDPSFRCRGMSSKSRLPGPLHHLAPIRVPEPHLPFARPQDAAAAHNRDRVKARSRFSTLLNLSRLGVRRGRSDPLGMSVDGNINISSKPSRLTELNLQQSVLGPVWMEAQASREGRKFGPGFGLGNLPVVSDSVVRVSIARPAAAFTSQRQSVS